MRLQPGRFLPLTGIRITEVSLHGTAPYCGSILGSLGAQVIRIENRYDVRDILRLRQPFGYNELNANKMSLTLDLKRPEAIDIAKRLVEISDVLLENFRPGVMKRLGLDYERVRLMKPDIVMLSASGYGQNGPEAGYSAIAGSFCAASGLMHITGYPFGIPTEQRSIFDHMVSQSMAFAIIAALMYRRRTGEGQHIDLAARETLVNLVGEIILEYNMNKRDAVRKGNRDDVMSPHNCYRCKGEDRWVSIAVATGDELESLFCAIGRPELMRQEKFHDSYARWKNQEELDAIIEQWTATYTTEEATRILQAAGVAAYPVMSSADVFASPHLGERGFIQHVDSSVLGRNVLQLGPPWLTAETRTPHTAAPSLGEHNEYVLGELLGLPGKEIARLEMAKIV